jgi:5-methylthioribose kinase
MTRRIVGIAHVADMDSIADAVRLYKLNPVDP